MPGVPVFCCRKNVIRRCWRACWSDVWWYGGIWKILEMPDGGFLYGEAYIAPAEDITEVLISYDS